MPPGGQHWKGTPGHTPPPYLLLQCHPVLLLHPPALVKPAALVQEEGGASCFWGAGLTATAAQGPHLLLVTADAVNTGNDREKGSIVLAVGGTGGGAMGED